jgi:hypothetical protein
VPFPELYNLFGHLFNGEEKGKLFVFICLRKIL